LNSGGERSLGIFLLRRLASRNAKEMVTTATAPHVIPTMMMSTVLMEFEAWLTLPPPIVNMVISVTDRFITEM